MSEVMVEYEPIDKEMQIKALSLKEQAELVCIKNEDDYIKAGQFVKEIKNHKEKIIAFFDPLKRAAFKTHKEITTREAIELKPLEHADKILRSAIAEYLNEQEQLRKKVQEKMETEALDKARKEQEKLLVQAIDAENKRKALFEEATKAESEKEKASLIAKAQKFEAKQELLENKIEDIYVSPVVIPCSIQKTTKLDDGNITHKKKTKITVVNAFMVIRAVADNKVPVNVIDFNMEALRTWARVNDIKNGDIPGLLVEEVFEISVR